MHCWMVGFNECHSISFWQDDLNVGILSLLNKVLTQFKLLQLWHTELLIILSNNIIIRCKFFSLFTSQEPTMRPANNCLQIMVCSCAMLFQLCLAVNNILLMHKWNHAFLPLVITLAWKCLIVSLPEDFH